MILSAFDDPEEITTTSWSRGRDAMMQDGRRSLASLGADRWPAGLP